MTRIVRTLALLSALLVCSAPAAAQAGLDKRVSLDLKSMAPREAFNVIATAVGCTVDVAADLTTPVDIVVPNVTARTALTTICESIGCTWQASGQVIVIRKRKPGTLLGAAAHANGTAADRRSAAYAEFRRRLAAPLPSDLKFDHAPMAQVAERLSKAVGLELSFVSAKPGQTLTSDLGNQTLMAALKTLSDQYSGAIVITMQDAEGNKAGSIMLQLGHSNRGVMRPKK